MRGLQFRAARGSIRAALSMLGGKALSCALVLAGLVMGVAAAAAPVNLDQPQRGWFWYEKPPIVEIESEPEVEPAGKPPALPAPASEPAVAAPVVAPSEEPPPCVTPKTWKAACGFVDPGEDFDFQALQRDELLRQMSVRKNDPEAVEAFQRYIKWVMGRASEIANLWRFNMVQNPELDPSVTRPISALGLDLASKVKSAADEDLFAYLRTVGKLVYFSKYDCIYCQQMTPVLRKLSRDVGMPVANVPLDGVCFPEYEECEVGPLAEQAGQKLGVTIVPALFLHVEPNTWLRIATGQTDAQTMKNRLSQFFTSYRHAMLQGINNGSHIRPSQDGSYTWTPTGVADGVALPGPVEVESMLRGGPTPSSKN